MILQTGVHCLEYTVVYKIIYDRKIKKVLKRHHIDYEDHHYSSEMDILYKILLYCKELANFCRVFVYILLLNI